LIEKLKEIPHLFSGYEFSENHVPENFFSHDIELIEGAPDKLTCKPFSVSGIRLCQLKDTIEEMVQNKVLIPGDSYFVSPIFFVKKGASGDQTASKGWLYDDRKLNALINRYNFLFHI
jgi:hypothetical protein